MIISSVDVYGQARRDVYGILAGRFCSRSNIDDLPTVCQARSVVEYALVTGQELREWRDRNGLSQARLAELLQVDVMTVSRWEREVQAVPAFLALALETIERRRKLASKQKSK